MTSDKQQLNIVMADDDPEDCLVVKEAFQESGLAHRIDFVHDGEELLDYLHCRGSFRTRKPTGPPDLILLDLNMPKKDGRETLCQVKDDPQLRPIPVVVLTTSTAKDDIGFSYRQGASSYITKPTTFRNWVSLASTLSSYWSGLVRLPYRG